MTTTGIDNNFFKASATLWLFCALLPWLFACSDSRLNNPHPPRQEGLSVYYSAFATPPKHLDPALSYATDESLLIDQIYEPPLGYHFLKRPYQLTPVAAKAMPEVAYLDADMQPVAVDGGAVAYTRYTFSLRTDLRYQPHPAFAKTADNKPLYLFDSPHQSSAFKALKDFSETGSRGAVANDFIYQIKRLADPGNKSPMLSFMSRYIVGMKDFGKRLATLERNGWLDLNDYPLEGLQQIDDHSYSILVYGLYPQFVYWQAMHFFAPVPPEVDRFYQNPGFRQKNLTLDWHPVGTGAYMMTKNDPNSEIILERNPNFHVEYYPSEGSGDDRQMGFLDDAGKQVPFIDKAIYRLEKESLPRWTKFLQGYYDSSGDNHSNTNGVFDQAFVVGPEGLELTPELAEHQLTIAEDLKPSIYYYGFNMRDPTLGGYTEKARKLRRALSLAYNQEDFINIFYKGNALPAQSPLPPGISGHLEGPEGINPYVYDWLEGEPKRKPIEYAQQLIAEAGYPNGRDAETGEPLKIFIDVQSQAIGNSQMDWLRRQMQEIGVQVEFRPADWNRTREKLLTGNSQIFSAGWLADYPDPENFLFLFFSPESPLVCQCDGANNSNYENPEFDRLFVKMRSMQSGPERDAVIARLVDMVRRDAVWMSSFHPREVFLNNPWVYNTKRSGISRRTLQYVRLDPSLREEKQIAWNRAVIWPLVGGLLLFIALLLPALRAYRRRQSTTVTQAIAQSRAGSGAGSGTGREERP